jgi:hypothetical protein
MCGIPTLPWHPDSSVSSRRPAPPSNLAPYGTLHSRTARCAYTYPREIRLFWGALHSRRSVPPFVSTACLMDGLVTRLASPYASTIGSPLRIHTPPRSTRSMPSNGSITTESRAQRQREQDSRRRLVNHICQSLPLPTTAVVETVEPSCHSRLKSWSPPIPILGCAR